MLGMAVATPVSANAPLNYLTGAGDKAYPVVALTWAMTIVSLAVIVIISILIAYSIWHRPGLSPPAPDTQLAVEKPQGGMSWVWIGVALSTLVLFGTVVWTMDVLGQITSPASKPPLTIEVTGLQWWWKVRYLSDDSSRIFMTANEIHIPVGVPVKFRLIGGDVIHSFWIPALGGKTDTIPGLTNETWLEARHPGVYNGQCTEYCGLEHAHMAIFVIAQTRSDFNVWWNHQLQSPAPQADGQVAAGRLDFNTHCASCHAVRGTDAAGVLGPDLSHLMTRKTIAAGLLPNDRINLARWIDDPQGLKPGSLMQKPELSDEERSDIEAYLMTLN